MKYILHLKDIDPENDMVIECSTGQETRDYKRKAEKMGYKVTVKKVVSHELK